MSLRAKPSRLFLKLSVSIVVSLLIGCGGDDPAASGAGGSGGSGTGTGVGGASEGGGGGALSPLDVTWTSSDALPQELTQRWGHVAAWLDDERAVIVGGTREGAESTVLIDAWLFDASTGAPSASPIATSATPIPRYCGCAVWDPDRERVLVVGGRDLSGPLAAETWELDPDGGTWDMVAVPTSPPGVIGCALARASSTGAIYLFGGGGDAGFDGGTYRYDPDAPAWVALDTTGPSPRYDAVMREAPDGSLVLVGGSMGSTFHADLWRFDVGTESWTQIPMQGTEPPGRRAPWFAAAPDGGFYVGFGLQGAQPLGDLWHASLTEPPTWTVVSYDALPGARAFSPALPGGLGWLIGGFDGTAPKADLWQLTPIAR